MVYKILVILIFCLNFGCTPTNQGLTDLVGGEATKTTTTPSDLGNQAFSFTPTTYDFGNRAVNTAPVTTTVTIRNISTHTIFLSAISGLSGVMTLVSDNCPRSPANIVPSQSCTATVSFAPSAGGLFNQMLTFTYGESVSANSTYSAGLTFTGTGVGSLAFNGITSVSDIYSSQLKLNWTTVAGALTYYVFRQNADNSLTLITYLTPPTSSYIVSGLSPSTTYKYWVRATDTLGAFDTNTNVVTTSTNTTPASPVLGGSSDYTFATANAITLGSTLTMDFYDYRTGVATDSGVTYNCAFDQVVNSSVTASGNCGTLPGTVSFSTTSGALSWTTTTQGAIGFYEFKVMVTDNVSTLTGSAIFTVDVRPAYSTTNLIANFSAMFSNATSNSTSGSTWQDLTTFNNDGTLTNITHGGLYGWLGAGTVASPYRLGLDGVNDYVDMSTTGNTATSMTLETWYKPSQINTSPVGYIISNGDSGNKGLTLREAKGYRNRVEAFVGNKSYADEVMADNPLVYLRMGDIAGDTAYDIGSGGFAWTLNSLGITSYELASPLGGNDKAMLFNSTSYGYYTGNVVNTSTWSGLTYETWFRLDTSHVLPTLFAHDSQQTGRSFFWFFINGGALMFQYVADGALRTTNSGLAPVLGTWYHVAVSLNFTSKLLEIYVNGVNTVSTTVPYTTILASNDNASLKIGTYSPSVTNYALDGGMDEAAVFNTALSGARISAHYNAKANYYKVISNRLDNSTYNHIAAAYNEFNTSLYLYTNSNLDGSVSTSAITLSGTSSQMAIGAKVPAVNSPTAGTYSLGEITDARVYSDAKTTSQIKSNMASQLDQFDIPKSPSGLIMWFDANDISTLYKTSDCSTTRVTSNGDAVACWKDKSGLSNNVTQAVTAQMPTYKSSNATLNNMPSLTFGASAYSLLTSGSLTFGARTYFAVTKTNGAPAGTYHTILIQNASPWYQMYASNTTAYYYSGVANTSTTSYTGNQLHTIVNSTTAGSSALNYRVNQVPVLTNTAVAASLTGTVSVGGYATNSYGLNGEILEVIVYNRALTDSEVLRVEGYLRAKYGL